MTQPARTTESASRDNAAIRDIMVQIQDRLTVPDRATLALGLIGHLATLMNGRQIEKLLSQLAEQASKVQDVPPARRQERDERIRDTTGRDERDDRGEQKASGGRETTGGRDATGRRDARNARDASRDRDASGRTHAKEVGVQGRGALTDDAGPIL
ncbi:MAG: hypothetical protein ACREKM_08810 [Longimicrobiales bacterium]